MKSPPCGWHSDKAHSRYQRFLADLPWEGVAVKLILSVRKFFCLNPDCRRRIFCERLAETAQSNTVRVVLRQNSSDLYFQSLPQAARRS